MKGRVTAELLFKVPGERNLCGCGRNTPPCFTGVLLQKGSWGPHNHCLITTSMRDECVLKGMWDRGQTQSRRGKPMETANMIKDIYLKAPQGLNMSFLQCRWMKVQSLENLDGGDRDMRKWTLCGREAAVRPSITCWNQCLMKTLTSRLTLSHTLKTNAVHFLTPLIIPIIHYCMRNCRSPSLLRQAADLLLMAGVEHFLISTQ